VARRVKIGPAGARNGRKATIKNMQKKVVTSDSTPDPNFS